ncbi:MAG: hypothetical protein ACJ8G3_18610, partial [Burkholderiaceae bacterium]
LQDAAPDVACRLLTRINNAYAEYRPLKDILPSPNPFKGELYGRFLKQALALLQTLPPVNVAEHLPQWRLPRPHGVDARLADEQVLLLLTALRSISRDSKLVSPEQQETTLAALMAAAVDDIDHSPLRNRRLLDALTAFPESVCAYSLRHLLGNLNQSRTHTDVLFASVIEAAGKLPDAARASVLEVAARELIRFPEVDALFHIDRPMPHKWRKAHFASRHPGLEASDPELHAIIRPGFITPMEGFALLLDAARTLPAVLHANVLGILCGKAHFSDFSSDDRLSDEQTLECSMRLLSSIISLPRAMTDLRARIFSDWLAHCALSFPEQHAATETRLLSTLFALPADVGKPLFEAYLSTVSDAPAKAVLKERAATNWEIRS